MIPKPRLSITGINLQIKSEHPFRCGDIEIGYTDKYKYLGVCHQEHLDLSVTVTEVSKSATRALGKVISTIT